MEQQLQDLEDRKFMIFNVTELPLVDFSQVLETSPNTTRRSVDGTKTLVKWETTTIPTSVAALTTKEGPYTYNEILVIMDTPEWTKPQ